MLPCILGLSGPSLTDAERRFFREAGPAGFILFRRNCEDPAQLRALTDDLRDLTGRAELPILIDQEGGRCARLAPPHWPAFPAQWRFAELYERAPISALEAARVNGLAIALVLREAGINVTCSPVLDLRHPGAHPVIGERALGSDPGRWRRSAECCSTALPRAGLRVSSSTCRVMAAPGRIAMSSCRWSPPARKNWRRTCRRSASWRGARGSG
jgi:beta-N-acetylhexosaminidase